MHDTLDPSLALRERRKKKPGRMSEFYGDKRLAESVSMDLVYENRERHFLNSRKKIAEHRVRLAMAIRALRLVDARTCA